VIAISSCALVAGLPDFEDRPPTADGGGGAAENAGGSAGAQGGGGAGASGGADPVPAADWTTAFDAVYTFEDEAELGANASRMGPDLLVGADANAGGPEVPQGMSALVLGGGDGLVSGDAFFDTVGPLTYGGWFLLDKDDDAAPEIPISRFAAMNGTTAGWRLVRGGSLRPSCVVGNGNLTADMASSGADRPMEVETWVHIVCLMGTDDVSLYFDGEHEETTSLTGTATSASGATLDIPSPAAPFVGQMDEVFFVRRQLSAAGIARIYACGIDGAKCRCDPEGGSSYVYCGRAMSCAALEAMVPCDAAPPGM
jgi:hypothetical protein